MISTGTPILVLSTSAKRETGRNAQMANIAAAKAIADIIMTTLGPQSMQKMLLDPMGGIVLTNDGHAILREIEVNHPAAKALLEISRAQDEEVGDGTTSVIILAAEMMAMSQPFLEINVHPSILVNAYYKALEFGSKISKELAIPIDINNEAKLREVIFSCIDTKFSGKWSDMITNLAVKSVNIILKGGEKKKLALEIKRFAKVEKIPGGSLDDCKVLDGIMINKELTHPQMRKTIKNPRIVLLDCPLEYKKGESQTNMEMINETAMSEALKEEVNEVTKLCADIIKLKPDIVVTEKGVSDLASHFFVKSNVSVIRRLRRTDNLRLARVSGATIINRPEELQESDIGTGCGFFEIQKIGDEFFAYFVECQNPKACSILLRGGSKDVLNEIERNLQDALAIVKNLVVNPNIVPGGGAFEMEMSKRLGEYAQTVTGVEQMPLKEIANALEIIPKTLAQNCGADVVRVLTKLRAQHTAENGNFFGINGITGQIADMRDTKIWEPLIVKEQAFKSAVEAAIMIIKIDDIVSGIKKKKEKKGGMVEERGGPGPEDDKETFGDRRDG